MHGNGVVGMEIDSGIIMDRHCIVWSPKYWDVGKQVEVGYGMSERCARQ